jgi:hypothetical protein
MLSLRVVIKTPFESVPAYRYSEFVSASARTQKSLSPLLILTQLAPLSEVLKTPWLNVPA